LTNFNQHKTDLLLKYILAVAGQESGWNRELGMIHLIKYVYLADLAYAEQHGGQTYTGITWVFHHFGPWSVECYHRIEPALMSIDAISKKIESDKYGDFIKWYTDDDELFDDLSEKIDLIIAGSVQKNVRKFGNDTFGLLDFVYKTPPMLKAAPEEILNFEPSTDKSDSFIDDSSRTEITVRQRKKQKQALAAFKEELSQRLEEKINARKSDVCPLPPRYDDVFFDGVAQLDEDEGLPSIEGEYIVNFNETVWKSKSRYDSELS